MQIIISPANDSNYLFDTTQDMQVADLRSQLAAKHNVDASNVKVRLIFYMYILF